MKLKTIATLFLMSFTSFCFATESETVKLDLRKQSEYEKSAYSFRYRSNDINKHKNYVDVSYESGRMRINHHGGMEAKIADLGKMDGLEEAATIKQSDAEWSEKALAPVEGNTYALKIREDKQEMVVVFHVKSVTAENLEFEWQPVGKGKWPIDISRRGAAGTSGMSSYPAVKRAEKSKAR